MAALPAREAALAPRPPRPRRRARRVWPVALLVLVLVAGIGWAAYLGSSFGDDGDDRGATHQHGRTTTARTTTTHRDDDRHADERP